MSTTPTVLAGLGSLCVLLGAVLVGRRSRREEEVQTPYAAGDGGGDHEFKILRSMTGAFRRPAVLRRVLAEEAQAGWELLEKFDDGRLRLRRRRGTATRTPGTGPDAYRIWVGPGPGAFTLMAGGGLLLAFAGLGTVLGLW